LAGISDQRHEKDDLEYFALENKKINWESESWTSLNFKKVDEFHLSSVYIFETCLKNFLSDNLDSVNGDDLSNLFRGSIRIKKASDAPSDIDFWLIDKIKLDHFFSYFNLTDVEKLQIYYPRENYDKFIKSLKINKINQEITFHDYVSSKIESLKDFFTFVTSHYNHSREIVCIYDF